MKSAAATNAKLSASLELFQTLDGEDVRIVRADRVTLRINQKNALAYAAKFKNAHKTFPRGAYKRSGAGREYPAFFTGMSTLYYVVKFQQLNASAHVLPIDFEALGDRPAALYENDALDFDVIEEPNEDYFATQAEQDVAQVLASAQAAAAIDQASESAALQEVADVANTEASANSAARELATVCEASSEQAQGASQGHASGSTSSQPGRSAQTAGQAIAGKSGKWHATFYTSKGGNPALAFFDHTDEDGGRWPERTFFGSGRERMAALQTMARNADTAAQAASAAPLVGVCASVQNAERPNPEDVSSGQFKSKPEPLASAFGGVIFCSPVVKYGQTQWTLCVYKHPTYGACTGYSWLDVDMGCWRQDKNHPRWSGNATDCGLPQSLKKLYAEHAQTIKGILDFYRPETPEEAASAALMAGVCDSMPTAEPQNPAPVSSSQFKTILPGVSGGVPSDAGQNPTGLSSGQFKSKTAADSGPEPVASFERVKPFNLDPRALLASGIDAAQLVGLGVDYTGNMATPDGVGAITAATDTRGERMGALRLVVTLEDGRIVHADPHYFTAELRPILQFNSKMHGAPYLAQLAGAAALLKAGASSAKEQAEQAYADALARLAEEFPQLKRQDSRHSGGVQAAANMRVLLKQQFKGVKFGVTSDYNSVNVRWTDGPTDAAVNAIIGRFDIGQADYNTDYFYTTKTPFSELFGGCQYLNTHRKAGAEAVMEALVSLFGEDGPTVDDYEAQRAWSQIKHGSGPWSNAGWHDEHYWLVTARKAASGEAAD